MSQETYQLAGRAAALYEAQKVPAIFAPLAAATLDAIKPTRDDTILDVACGTGIVARLARRRLGPGPRIVGADLNDGMVATARALPEEEARSCEWQVADVTALPFPDDAFTLAICQQGIQFFPDPLAALLEICRVVRPGGRVVLTVWAGVSPFFAALADALGRHVSEETGRRSLAPFAFDGIDRLASAMAEFGCTDIAVSELSVDRHIAEAETAIPREILANPVGPAVEARGDTVMRQIVADTLRDLSDYRSGTGLVVPQRSYLLQARVH